MKQSEYNSYKELCDNIFNALADAYEDEPGNPYEFAVNPATFEVQVVGSYLVTPEGWIYESIVDAEWETIEECAKQYFDFRS